MTTPVISGPTRVALSCLLLCAAFVSLPAAADIGRQLRDFSGPPQAAHGGHLEVGLALEVFQGAEILGEQQESPRIVGAVNGMYHWRGLFVEVFSEGQDVVLLGYNLGDTENWSFDAIVGPKHRPIDTKANRDFAAIGDRDSDSLAGLRATGYLDNYLVQFQLRGDVSDSHGGWWASGLAGRNWQWRNWNFHSMFGLDYSSAELNDYYFGISPEVANSQFPSFEAGDGLTLMAEFGVTYPLSKRWILRGTARYSRLPDSKVKSPVMDSTDNNQYQSVISLSYIF